MKLTTLIERNISIQILIWRCSLVHTFERNTMNDKIGRNEDRGKSTEAKRARRVAVEIPSRADPNGWSWISWIAIEDREATAKPAIASESDQRKQLSWRRPINGVKWDTVSPVVVNYTQTPRKPPRHSQLQQPPTLHSLDSDGHTKLSIT